MYSTIFKSLSLTSYSLLFPMSLCTSFLSSLTIMLMVVCSTSYWMKNNFALGPGIICSLFNVIYLKSDSLAPLTRWPLRLVGPSLSSATLQKCTGQTLHVFKADEPLPPPPLPPNTRHINQQNFILGCRRWKSPLLLHPPSRSNRTRLKIKQTPSSWIIIQNKGIRDKFWSAFLPSLTLLLSPSGPSSFNCFHDLHTKQLRPCLSFPSFPPPPLPLSLPFLLGFFFPFSLGKQRCCCFPPLLLFSALLSHGDNQATHSSIVLLIIASIIITIIIFVVRTGHQ